MAKRIRSTSLYHSRQCDIVLEPRSNHTDYAVICFTTHDCSQKNAQTVSLPLQAQIGLIGEEARALL